MWFLVKSHIGITGLITHSYPRHLWYIFPINHFKSNNHWLLFCEHAFLTLVIITQRHSPIWRQLPRVWSSKSVALLGLFSNATIIIPWQMLLFWVSLKCCLSDWLTVEATFYKMKGEKVLLKVPVLLNNPHMVCTKTGRFWTNKKFSKVKLGVKNMRQTKSSCFFY